MLFLLLLFILLLLLLLFVFFLWLFLWSLFLFLFFIAIVTKAPGLRVLAINFINGPQNLILLYIWQVPTSISSTPKVISVFLQNPESRSRSNSEY